MIYIYILYNLCVTISCSPLSVAPTLTPPHFSYMYRIYGFQSLLTTIKLTSNPWEKETSLSKRLSVVWRLWRESGEELEYSFDLWIGAGGIEGCRNHTMHAKTDSEVTSLAASSTTRSPRRPVYYVQSPSRDSHDGEKTTTSFHSTPVLSPMGSPPHSHSSVGRHSRESSSSRFSGSLKPGSRKISPNDASRGGHRKGEKPWKECAVIEEEGLLEDEERQKGLPRRCYFLAFVVGFFVLFSLFSLILWGASKPQKPKITMKVRSLHYQPQFN